MPKEDLPRLEIRNLGELESWLEQNHGVAGSHWLVTFKAGHAGHVAWQDYVDVLLCFGWVDSLPRKLDQSRTMRRISPRDPKSGWSRLNRDKVAALMQANRMRAAGIAAVELAKTNGQWHALDEFAVVPPDLEAALSRYNHAHQHFTAFPASIKRAILEWIGSAKRADTRAKRIGETALLAQDNIRANQWRQ